GEVVGGGVEAQHARGNTEEEDGGIGRDGDRARIQSREVEETGERNIISVVGQRIERAIDTAETENQNAEPRSSHPTKSISPSDAGRPTATTTESFHSVDEGEQENERDSDQEVSRQLVESMRESVSADKSSQS